MAILNISDQQYYEDTLKAKLTLEERLRRKLVRLLNRYANELYSSMLAYKVPVLGDAFYADLSELLLQHYNTVGTYFSNFTTNNLNPALSINSKRIMDSTLQSLYGSFYDRASFTAESVKDTIQRESLQAEVAYRKLADQSGTDINTTSVAAFIQGLLKHRAASKALTISITETTWASETTKEEEVKQITKNIDEDNDPEDIADLADVTEEERRAILLYGYAGAVAGGYISQRKTWIAVLDSRTRPWHASANGQQVPIDDPFLVGGEKMPYPGMGSAGNSANCRCVVVYDLL